MVCTYDVTLKEVSRRRERVRYDVAEESVVLGGHEWDRDSKNLLGTSHTIDTWDMRYKVSFERLERLTKRAHNFRNVISAIWFQEHDLISNTDKDKDELQPLVITT